MDTAQGGSAAGAELADTGGSSRSLVVGKVASPFGVRGWTKVVSYTDPRIGLLDYSQWELCQGREIKAVEVSGGREHGKFLVVKFEGIDDRDQVALLTNAEIKVERDQFPQAQEGTFYWADLVGLHVVTVDGVELGVIESMLETGANDVMVVKGDRERLVPWIQPDVVTGVDLQRGRLTVDWDPDF